MKRSAACFLAVAMLSVAVVFFLAPSAEAGGNCQDKLGGNYYKCDLKNSDGDVTSFCMGFTIESGKLVLNSAPADFGDLECVCDATGKYSSASFDASSSAFECVEGGTQVNGKLKGKTFTGQGSNEENVSFVYTCTLVSSCG
jgi:hypothetical protein